MFKDKFSKAVLSSFLIGLTVFCFVYGFNILNPSNILWLTNADTYQAYIGWEFFRNSSWNFPIIGLSPEYGIMVSSSIVYTDSNPLFAVVMKLFSPILPETFQYFGFWILVCCVLNAAFLWKIISRFTESYFLVLVSVCLLMLYPAWLNRVGHLNLMAHFIILAAIDLCIDRENKNKPYKWALLLLLGCSIHFYIAMMAYILWAGNLIARTAIKVRPLYLVVEFISIITSSLVLMYILGYFTVKDVSGVNEFGSYANNLLSPFLPGGWSRALEGVITLNIGFESFNYWGLGIIALFFYHFKSLIKLLSRDYLNPVRLGLIFSVASFILISTTNKVQFGNHTSIIYIPSFLTESLSIFRASARFFWPVSYLVFLTLIWITIKENSKNKAIFILTLTFIIQAYDTSVGYSKSRFYFFNHENSKLEFNREFWSNELKSHNSIEVVPFSNQSVHWAKISTIANTYHIQTSAVYLARFNSKKALDLNIKNISSLYSGTYSKSSIYVINEDMISDVKLRTGDSIYKVDGLYILSPGMQYCISCEKVNIPYARKKFIFIGGWSTPESDGVWADGKNSAILILSDKDVSKIKINYSAYISKKTPTQALYFEVDGKVLKSIRTPDAGSIDLEWTNNPNQNFKILMIHSPNAISPKEEGVSGDARQLSIKLKSLIILN